jgi:FkbM family methyltransferase
MQFVKKIKTVLLGLKAPKKFDEILKTLDSNSRVLDLGANVGDYSILMAKTGSFVFSYEPNPYAFKKLLERTKSFSNIKCFNKAVSDKNGKVKLYLHENHKIDPIKWSTGSSIDKNKKNVSDDFVEVECVNIIQILNDSYFDLIKMDVEGQEIEILNKILDNSLSNRFGSIFVEMHDKKMIHLKQKSAQLRNRIKEGRLYNIYLDWH